MKDNRIHYPKEPILFDLAPGLFKTALTMCAKRRDTDRVTNKLSNITCGECIAYALAYWQQQAYTYGDLISYAESGKLKGTSAEKEGAELLPKLRTALEQANTAVAELHSMIGLSK